MKDELIEKIYNECKEQFDFEEKIKRIVQDDIVCKINEYINSIESDESKLIAKAITYLVSQGIRNYDSSMLLIHHGYATNALVNLRQMVEILLEIEYILENDKEVYCRAKNYLQGGNKVSKKKKSIYSFKTLLYSEYEILCEHSHANISALNLNENGNIISIKANDVLVKEVSLVVNSTFCYFLECIFKYYKIDKKIIDDIDIPQNIQSYIKNYNFERNFCNDVFRIIGFTEEDISELGLMEEFKEYKKNKLEKNKRKK